jgi:hypothetical protein
MSVQRRCHDGQGRLALEIEENLGRQSAGGNAAHQSDLEQFHYPDCPMTALQVHDLAGRQIQKARQFGLGQIRIRSNSFGGLENGGFPIKGRSTNESAFPAFDDVDSCGGVPAAGKFRIETQKRGELWVERPFFGENPFLRIYLG